MKRLGGLAWFYLIAGGALLAAYLAATVSGWEAGTSRPGVVPASVRTSPGGYRSFHFWHTGYQGGK
jgi:hypothetical protein